MSLLSRQGLLISICLLTGIGLWFSDRKGAQVPKKEDGANAASQGSEQPQININWAYHLDSVLHLLPKEKQSLGVKLLEASKTVKEKSWAGWDSLSALINPREHPTAAAYVLEIISMGRNNSSDWVEAGKGYYRSAQAMSPEAKAILYSKAIYCFEKANSIAPSNPENLTALGVCFVEGSKDPMKGIGFLREALTIDSTYSEAHFQLGLFAIQSGQFDKAEARMKKVLALNKSSISAYLYLAEIYQRTGRKNEAVATLETYKSLASDPSIRAEIDRYLNELKNI